jgi:hypothetical protein
VTLSEHVRFLFPSSACLFVVPANAGTHTPRPIGEAMG